MSNPDYLEINKKFWNQKVDIHFDSSFYGVDEFLKSRNSLNDIELSLLGNIRGKSLLHLQCHFGQDSISLARLGAKVTAVDFSDQAIQRARELAVKAESHETNFVCSDIYTLPDNLKSSFDIVFSSYGTIGWLPDIHRWAQVVSHFLKPGGRFVFAEFHPVVWMFDDDFTKVAYRYFNSGPILETENQTYADQIDVPESQYIGWNHGLSEVIQALTDSGLFLQIFREYDYSPYRCFKHMKEVEKGKYVIESMEQKLPLVYALCCVKNLDSIK